MSDEPPAPQSCRPGPPWGTGNRPMQTSTVRSDGSVLHGGLLCRFSAEAVPWLRDGLNYWLWTRSILQRGCDTHPRYVTRDAATLAHRHPNQRAMRFLHGVNQLPTSACSLDSFSRRQGADSSSRVSNMRVATRRAAPAANRPCRLVRRTGALALP